MKKRRKSESEESEKIRKSAKERNNGNVEIENENEIETVNGENDKRNNEICLYRKAENLRKYHRKLKINVWNNEENENELKKRIRNEKAKENG